MPAVHHPLPPLPSNAVLPTCTRLNTDGRPAPIPRRLQYATPVSSAALVPASSLFLASPDMHKQLSPILPWFTPSGLGHAFRRLCRSRCIGRRPSSFQGAAATACAAPCMVSFPHPTAPRAHRLSASASGAFPELRVSRRTHCLLLAADSVWELDPLPQLRPSDKWRLQLLYGHCPATLALGLRSFVVISFLPFGIPPSFAAHVWSQVLAHGLMSHLGSTDYTKSGNRLLKWGPTDRETRLTTRGLCSIW
jgi:hypothetical protein